MGRLRFRDYRLNAVSAASTAAHRTRNVSGCEKAVVCAGEQYNGRHSTRGVFAHKRRVPGPESIIIERGIVAGGTFDRLCEGMNKMKAVGAPLSKMHIVLLAMLS